MFHLSLASGEPEEPEEPEGVGEEGVGGGGVGVLRGGYEERLSAELRA